MFPHFVCAEKVIRKHLGFCGSGLMRSSQTLLHSGRVIIRVFKARRFLLLQKKRGGGHDVFWIITSSVTGKSYEVWIGTDFIVFEM